jgi:hypothetical protein
MRSPAILCRKAEQRLINSSSANRYYSEATSMLLGNGRDSMSNRHGRQQ